jgi:hypothetical protein
MINKNIQLQTALLMAIILAIACIAVLYSQHIIQYYPTARQWHWVNVYWLLPAIPFLLLQRKAGLIGPFDSITDTSKRYGLPLFTGFIFGLLDLIVLKFLQHPEPYQSLPAFLQPFPYSIFLYSAGAFEVEIYYRLIPITAAMLLGRCLLNGKYAMQIFWAIAILTSLREPIEQLPSQNIWFIIYSFVSGFAMNFFQAYYYKEAGFAAAISTRLGHYLVWHILLGIFVQYVELGGK